MQIKTGAILPSSWKLPSPFPPSLSPTPHLPHFPVLLFLYLQKVPRTKEIVFDSSDTGRNKGDEREKSCPGQAGIVSYIKMSLPREQGKDLLEREVKKNKKSLKHQRQENGSEGSWWKQKGEEF